jgi:hypothetical protein
VLPFACAVLGDGRVACWGQITGAGALAFVPGVDDAIDVSAGMGQACIRRRSGRVSCVGVDDFGELGDGVETADDLVPSLTPRNVLHHP